MLKKLTTEDLADMSDETLSLREMFKNSKDYYLDFGEIVFADRVYMYSKNKLTLEDDGENSSIIKYINSKSERKSNKMMCCIDENTIEDSDGNSEFACFTISVRHIKFSKYKQLMWSYYTQFEFNLETAREIVPLVYEYIKNNKIIYAIDNLPADAQQHPYVKHLIAKAQSDYAELKQIIAVINS